MRIQNIQAADRRSNFTGISLIKDSQLLNERHVNQINNFLSNEKTQKFVDLLEQKYKADCLLVPRESDCIVHVGKQEGDKFNLYYISYKIDDFVSKARKIVSTLKNPKALSELQEKAAMREYARETNRATAALPGFMFCK